mgnify:CR=1 FL=1
MPDNVIARSPMTEIEDRLGVRPLEELKHERRMIVETLSVLKARYGSFGTFEHERKILLATLGMKARAILTRDNLKVTALAEWLSDQSHAAPEYYDFITRATNERSQLTMLENRVTDIEDEIRRGDAIIRHQSAEARL